jgi:hypothetical protein
MGTHNGFGTMYYGWTALPDGTAEATRWLVAAFFPVIPLQRLRIRVLETNASKPVFLLFAGHGFGTQLEVVEKMPLDWFSILKTYFNGYIVVPIILAAPVAVLIGLLLLLEGPLRQLGIDPKGVSIPVLLLILVLLYWGLVVAYILDNTSGRRIRKKDACVDSIESDSFE